MMNKTKMILASLICSLILSVFQTTVRAFELTEIKNNSSNKSFEIAEEISKNIEFDDVVAKSPLSIGDKTIELYVEFENTKKALDNLYSKYSFVFDELKSKYSFNTLNESNFDDYYNQFLLSLDDDTCTYKNNEIIYDDFVKFYDIFENSLKNRQITNLVSNLKLSNRTTIENSDLYDDLTMIIPTYNELFEQINEKKIIQYNNILQTRALTAAQISKAKTYAETYATNPNFYSYAYFSADCTNFASQILEAAGINQVSTTSQSTGWWHRVENNEHVHSYSWIRADAFARYIGIWGRYTSFQTLSLNVKTGDFLAEDHLSDGDFDHIGFVWWVNDTQGTYTDEDGVTRTYKNMRIAQHTSNYICYVTDDNNDWEKMTEKGKKIAIIGRTYTG